MVCRVTDTEGRPIPRQRAGRLLSLIALGTALSTAPGTGAAQPPCRTAFEAPEFAFAAGCLIRRGDRMLVVRHRFGGKLGVPGGRTGSGESAQCVAHRETWEETGVDVVVHGMLKRFPNGFALYRCTPADAAAARAGELDVPPSGRNEVTAVLWIDPRDTAAPDWRFPRDYRELLRLFDE